MKTIVLGREGDQPFSMKEDMDGVSRKHAQITITDNGDWYLEDLGSSNGTAIRDEKTGNLIPISGKRMITPMTFIFLGPDNSRGCCFFAKQANSYGDFMDEHQYLIIKEEEYDKRVQDLEKKIKRMRIAGPIIVICAVFLITCIPFISNILGTHAMEIRCVLSVLSGILPTLYDGTSRKRELQNSIEHWHYCPNPCCSNKQTSKEIKNMKCSKCKK